MGLFYFILTLTILVGIHEWGHYIVARLCGVAVSDFAIGFGRELVGWTNKSGTRFSLRMIPLGGYVKMLGSEVSDDATEAERKTGFAYKSPWQRLAIAFAGPAVNFLFAIVVLAGMAMAGKPTLQAEIGAVSPGMPAAAAGMVAGDRIVSIDGVIVGTASEASKAIQSATGALTMTLDRNGQTVNVTVTPDPQSGKIGIQYSGAYTLQDGVGPIDAVVYGTTATWQTSVAILDVLGDLFSGERSVQDLGGLVSIGKAADQSASTGWYVFFGFLAMMSINLAVMNLLPIPGLDGSHIVLNILEGVGIKLPQRVINALFMSGFVFLIGFMLFVNLNDILRLEVVQELLNIILGRG